MIVRVNAEKLEALLKTSEDAEALGGGEYTLDLYDVETPVSLDLEITKKGVDVLAALELCYDEAEDGWYLGEKIKDAARLERLIGEAIDRREG